MAESKKNQKRAKIPLPINTVELIKKVNIQDRHPGLQLDKFREWSFKDNKPEKKQGETEKDALKKICDTCREETLFKGLSNRRKDVFKQISAMSWLCKTTGPLTLHLSRASAFENAGICLHPLYGFVYLPGSGLKGMARAYAETIWLQGQKDQIAGWQKIEKVFGWAPGSDKDKNWKPGGTPSHGKEDSASCGAVIFHDAWPEEWPKLELDIVNNHHKEYYSGNRNDKDSGNGNDKAPGDWEDPRINYFLCVGAGVIFSFAISKRSPQVDNKLLDLAKEWLTGALTYLGAGAKTNAGYGCFKPVNEEAPALPAEARKTFETTLELVSPAFLAGANQQAGDCDLRPATLRGLLRWWWRTMHAGYVDVATLRKLEAAVWGDTNVGGAARISVEQENDVHPVEYKKEEFKKANILERPPDKTTTQGLFYLSFGMDYAGRQRFYIAPNAKWRLKIIIRPSYYGKNSIDPGRISTEVTNSLWLLCHFGAVGSKSRNGFGSLRDLKDVSDINKCKKDAMIFRSDCGIDNKVFDEEKAGSPSLEQMLGPLEIPTPWKNYWFTLDQLGFAVQMFAKKYKHNVEKKALGLPRRIGEPTRGKFDSNHSNRHASPVFYHLDKDEDHSYIIRITAFPAKYLPNLNDSKEMLTKLLDHLKKDLEKRVKYNVGKGQAAVKTPRRAATGPQKRSVADLPRAGDRVEVVLLEEKTKKGGWKAQHKPSGLSGHIINTNDVPPDKKPEDIVQLIVHSCTEKQISFRWPTNN